jgi:hypothetical protein
MRDQIKNHFLLLLRGISKSKNQFTLVKHFLKTILFLSILSATLFGCEPKPRQWVYTKTIQLDGIEPIGIVQAGDHLWLSDVDNDRIVKIDHSGNVQQEIKNLIRPMHIAGNKNELYIPQFGADNIVRWDAEGLHSINIADSLDAPGGVDVDFGMMAVADFFNHRVLVTGQEKSFIIGKEGHDNGSLYYPTDVEITNELIYIADAYNNRVEVYNHNGEYVRTIGWQEGIKVAAGVGLGNDQIFITDFHGNRLLIYDKWGKLIYEFKEHLSNPTDVLVIDNKLFVVNFKGHSLTVFELK